MYKKHRDFESPTDSATLWRYMDLSKLIALLDGRCLFFARADRLGDPWEGATSQANLHFREILDTQAGVGYRQLADTYKASRRHTYISCWHENLHESAAMWRLYLKSDEGIAIQTTFERLRESFWKAEKAIQIGKVHYYDPISDVLPEGNVLRQYLRKRKSFSHECEVRAIYQEYPILGFDGGDPAAEYGLNIGVDTEKLVENVYLSPTSPAWLVEVVQAVLNRFDMRRTVVRSALDADPVF